jgi:hypothetical protein
MLLLIFIIAIAILMSVSIGLFLNWVWSAAFVADDDPEPPEKPCDLDDPEERREFERRYPPIRRI